MHIVTTTAFKEAEVVAGEDEAVTIIKANVMDISKVQAILEIWNFKYGVGMGRETETTS